MDKFADAMMQNLPEMLARDLADQENVFLSRNKISGRPSMDLTYETRPPCVPQRNPSRVLHRLHHVGPETFLCSLKQNSVESAWRSERGAIHKNVTCRCPSSRALRRGHRLAPRQLVHMKQDTEQDARRLFLNGLDEGWGSDSSADAETGLSSPSVRTRKQSITTAATSVDFQLNSGDKGMEGYPAEAFCVRDHTGGHLGQQKEHQVDAFSSEHYLSDICHKGPLVNEPDNQDVWLAGKEGGSWVDLGEHATGHYGDDGSGRRHYQGIESPQCTHDAHQPGGVNHAMSTTDKRHQFVSNQPVVGLALAEMPRIPRRRSSLTHSNTMAVLSEGARLPSNPTAQSPPELPSQLLPSPPPPIPSPRRQHPAQEDWNATGPVVTEPGPTGSHQVDHNLKLDLSSNSSDQLSLPPLSANATTNRDRSYHDRSFSLRSQHQQPNLLSKPRKSHSITRMPLRNVHHWLESARQHSPPLMTTSPIAMSPTSNVRVSGPILESLRMNVQNFPDTMLLTSSVTIDQIRDYSYKVKRSDTTRQLLPTHESEELLTKVPRSPSSPTSPVLGRKTSFGNLKRSFRGKFSRFTSATSPSIHEQGEADWPPIDDAAGTTIRCDSPPLGPTAARDAACIQALHKVVDHGTPYLLDALYAHILAYNYIDSLCGSLPEPHQSSQIPHLRTRPSKNFILPAGVTSLADLMVQEDSSDAVVREFQDDIASISSKNAVPSKAALLLGLDSPNRSQSAKPNPGSFGGRENSSRKISPFSTSKGHYLESESAMRSLREDIILNIQRLVNTAESCSSDDVMEAEEVQDSNMARNNGKPLEPKFMRALSEIVRSYEMLSC